MELTLLHCYLEACGFQSFQHYFDMPNVLPFVSVRVNQDIVDKSRTEIVKIVAKTWLMYR